MSTWTRVEPLVENVEVRGRAVAVRFRCPASGRTVQASVHVPHTMGTKVRAVATRSLYYAFRESIFFSVRRMLGWSFLGRFASYFVTGLLPAPPDTHETLGEGERQEAVLSAFKQVQGQFGWDERNHRYVSMAALQASSSAFERLIAEHPVTESWDQEILARVLATVARADGSVHAQEAALFGEQDGHAAGTLADLRPPTVAELAETSPPVRETVLVLAWAMAWADGHGDDAERAELNRMAQALGIPDRRAKELSDIARAGMIEQLIADAGLDGRLDEPERAHLAQLAAAVGLARPEYERLEAATRRRLGIG